MKKLFTFVSLFLFAWLPILSAQNVAKARPTTPSPFCNPCLFYGGDLGSNGNGIENADTLLVGFVEILVPFDVPAAQVWKALGLFTNNLPTLNVFAPEKAMWSVRQNVQPGDCGTLLASGESAATITPTGNTIQGMTEYNVLVTIPPLQLSSGRYWLSVVPECLDPGNSNCSDVIYYISVFQGTGPGAYGPPEPNNDSFLSYSLTGTDCQFFSGFESSAGVLGASDTPYRGQ